MENHVVVTEQARRELGHPQGHPVIVCPTGWKEVPEWYLETELTEGRLQRFRQRGVAEIQRRKGAVVSTSQVSPGHYRLTLLARQPGGVRNQGHEDLQRGIEVLNSMKLGAVGAQLLLEYKRDLPPLSGLVICYGDLVGLSRGVHIPHVDANIESEPCFGLTPWSYIPHHSDHILLARLV